MNDQRHARYTLNQTWKFEAEFLCIANAEVARPPPLSPDATSQVGGIDGNITLVRQLELPNYPGRFSKQTRYGPSCPPRYLSQAPRYVRRSSTRKLDLRARVKGHKVDLKAVVRDISLPGRHARRGDSSSRFSLERKPVARAGIPDQASPMQSFGFQDAARLISPHDGFPQRTWGNWAYAAQGPNSSLRDDLEMVINIDVAMANGDGPALPSAAQGCWRSLRGELPRPVRSFSEPICRTGYHRRYWEFHPDIVVVQDAGQDSSRPKVGHTMGWQHDSDGN